jgi:hypothetical protein
MSDTVLAREYFFQSEALLRALIPKMIYRNPRAFILALGKVGLRLCKNFVLECWRESNQLAVLLRPNPQPDVFPKYSKLWFLNSVYLSQQREIVLEAVKQDGSIIRTLPIYFKDDREIVLAAVKQNGSVLKNIPDHFKDDLEVVLTALEIKEEWWVDNRRCDYRTFECISPRLRKERQVVLAGVKSDGRSLFLVAKKFRSDRDIALSAVSNYGGMLYILPSKFREDEEICKIAIKNDISSMIYARPIGINTFAHNRTLVHCLVSNYGEYLAFASSQLRKDKEIVSTAVKNNSNAMQFIDRELLNDARFMNKLKYYQ